VALVALCVRRCPSRGIGGGVLGGAGEESGEQDREQRAEDGRVVQTHGGYWGPTGRFGLVGPTGPARLPARARDAALAERFWRAAEELTGVTLPAAARTP
jgi:hypothetical protein